MPISPLRIVIIGGGSFNWTPDFVRDLITHPGLQGSTIVLHDIDSSALDLTFALNQKMVTSQGSSCTVEKTLNLDAALEGADIVLQTITTGALETMRADIEIPQKYGVYQSVGDTVGPGGLVRALRNIPVVVDIAHKMEAICPNAWLLNYTNPMTTLCRAVTRETHIKTVGLCHEYFGGLHALQTLFDVPAEAIETQVGGINHLIWLLDLKVNEREAFAALHEHTAKILREGGRVVQSAGHVSLQDQMMVKARLFQVFGSMPMAGDRHVAEFFPFFLSEAAGKGDRYRVARTTIAERYQWRASAEARIRGLLNGTEDMAAFLAENSGEAAAPICAALAAGRPYTGIMNLPNRGQIADLPMDAVVETLGVLNAEGVRGLPIGKLPPAILAIVERHVRNQEMIVSAALSGDRALALQALVNDPLVTDIDNAKRMLDEMLIATREYLPRFFTNLASLGTGS
jgi:alpha-galactosidase